MKKERMKMALKNFSSLRRENFIKLFKCDSFAFLSGWYECTEIRNLVEFELHTRCLFILQLFVVNIRLRYAIFMPDHSMPCRAVFCFISFQFPIASFQTQSFFLSIQVIIWSCCFISLESSAAATEDHCKNFARLYGH